MLNKLLLLKSCIHSHCNSNKQSSVCKIGNYFCWSVTILLAQSVKLKLLVSILRGTKYQQSPLHIPRVASYPHKINKEHNYKLIWKGKHTKPDCSCCWRYLCPARASCDSTDKLHQKVTNRSNWSRLRMIEI